MQLKSIGARLAFARAQAKLSQKTLAKLVGVSQGAIGNIEANTRRNPRELLAIARALGVCPEWLKDGTGVMRAQDQLDAALSSRRVGSTPEEVVAAMAADHERLRAITSPPEKPTMSSHTPIGPAEMGQQLLAALGLEGVKGVMKLEISCEGGRVPRVTVVRTITQEQAGAACLLLKEWQCELVSCAAPLEREVSADGSLCARAPGPACCSLSAEQVVSHAVEHGLTATEVAALVSARGECRSSPAAGRARAEQLPEQEKEGPGSDSRPAGPAVCPKCPSA